MKAYRLSYGSLAKITPAEAATARGAIFYGESMREVLENFDANGIGKYIFQDKEFDWVPDPTRPGHNKQVEVPVDGYKEALDSINYFGSEREHLWFNRKCITGKDIPEMLEFDPDGKKLKGIEFSRRFDGPGSTYEKYFTKAGTWAPATAVSRLKLARKRADGKLTKAKAQNEFKLKVPTPSMVIKPLVTVMANTIKDRIKFMVHPYMMHGFNAPTVEQYVEYIEEISPLFDFVVGKKNAYRLTTQYEYLFNSIQPQIKLIREAVKKETAQPIWKWVVDEYPIYLRNLRKKEKETQKND